MIDYYMHICPVVLYKLLACFENYKSKKTIRKTNYVFEMEPKRSWIILFYIIKYSGKDFVISVCVQLQITFTLLALS